MNDFRWLIRVSRPRFWLYVFGPFMVGTAAAVHTNVVLIDRWTILFAIYFLFPANLLIYGINDIYDFETDQLNAKKQSYEETLLPDFRRKLSLYILIFNLPFIIGAISYGLTAALLLALFLFFSIFYSAPPIRAKAIPFLDSVFNILYVVPGILAFKLLADRFPSLNIITAASLWTIAMHAYSAIPDIEADRGARITTIATLLGYKLTLKFCGACFIASAVLLYPFSPAAAIILCSIYSAAIALSFNYHTRIFSLYRLFPLINAVCGFVLFWAAALSF